MNGRLPAVLALAVLPWSVVITGAEVTLVFPFGMVDPSPFSVTDLYSYVFVHTRALPAFLLAWPLGVLAYLGAVASAVSGRLFDREDRRLSGALLVLAGLTQVTMAVGFSRRLDYVALPVGTVLCLAVAWWFDWPALRRTVGLSPD